MPPSGRSRGGCGFVWCRLYVVLWLIGKDARHAHKRSTHRTCTWHTNSYIGAFPGSKPANTARGGAKPEAISMTAPVVMPQGTFGD